MMTLHSHKSTNMAPLSSTHNFTKFFCLIALLALLCGTTSAQGQSPATGLVSTNSVGNSGGNVGAYAPSVSADGRFVAFVSASRDLVPNDTNEREDVFVRDRQTGLTKMVSINVSGTGGGDQHSSNPTITPDGRFVVFNSSSSNLVANDPTTLLYSAIFVRDLQLGVTKLVTRNLTGDRRANGSSGSLHEAQAISADGRFIAFTSSSTDLVANDTNNRQDIFVRDMQTNTTTLISTGRAGSADVNEDAAHPVMTPDGRFVAYRSAAAIYVRDLQAGITKMVSVNRFGTGNGNRPSDEGVHSSLAISADGRYVAFVSSASDLVEGDSGPFQDVFIRDTQSNTTSLVSVDSAGVSPGNAPSGGLTMTPDGHFIAFTSGASNLVSAVDSNNQQDVFLRNLTTNTTTLMSINRLGSAGGSYNAALSGDFGAPAISDDGRYVSFTSNANDLTEISDGNNTGILASDVFVRDTQAGITRLVSINNTGTASGNGSSGGPIMTPDGRYIVYGSGASDLVAHDSNGYPDLFSFINIPQSGQIQFLTAVTSANENSAVATITVTLLNGSSNPVSVDYSTLNSTAVAGVDYIAKAGTLSFNPGETSKTFDIQILDDSLDENDEKVIIRLANPTNDALLGEPSVAALSITDDDLPPTISINDVNVDEGDSGNRSATFSLSLSAPSGRTVSVDVATSDGSAIAWSDYGPGLDTITFSPGVTTRSIAVPVIGDMVREGNETFVVDLTNPVNATITKAKGIGTIVDNDGSQPNTLQFSRTSQTIGEWGGNGSIEVTRTDTTGSATVDFATSDNFPASQNCQAANTGIASSRCGDYATTTGTLQFAVGETSKTIFVPIVNDKVSEGSETFTISLSNPTGSSLGSVSTVSMTIIDDETPPGPIQLVLDESGPVATQAAAIDSLLFLRDPFPVISEASWWNQGADRNTRVLLFVNNLQMDFIAPSSVVLNLTDGSSQIYNVAAADIKVVPGFSFAQVTFRLPDTLAPGTCTIKVKMLSRESNSGTIRIRK